MRTTADRIRHAISFEAVSLVLLIPLGAWVYVLPLQEIGVVTIVSSTIATVWNYVYNILFDRALLRVVGDLRKTPAMRVFHIIVFELGLLAVLMPFIAWYLGVSLWMAMVMDVSFSLFYMVYGFFFNWAYDVVFPIPDPLGTAQDV
jgi:uncharacterized membrane protein